MPAHWDSIPIFSENYINNRSVEVAIQTQEQLGSYHYPFFLHEYTLLVMRDALKTNFATSSASNIEMPSI